MQDGADNVAKTLKDGMAGTPGGVNDELITNAGVNPADTTLNNTPTRTRSWTANDLRNALLGSRHDLVYLAGHFSANDALAADYTSVLTTTQLKESRRRASATRSSSASAATPATTSSTPTASPA